MKNDIRDIVQEYVDNNPELNNTEIADLILEDGAIDKAHRTIRRYVGEIKDAPAPAPTPEPSIEDAIKELQEAGSVLVDAFLDEELNGPYISTMDIKEMIMPPKGDVYGPPPTDLDFDRLKEMVLKETLYEEGPKEVNVYDKGLMTHDKFKVEKGVYHVTHQRTAYELEAKHVDTVFCAYSKKGMNLTKHQILEMFDMDSEEFNCMTNRLGLSKESKPYGPYTDEFFTEEEAYGVIQECTSKIVSLETKTDNTVVEALVRENKKQYAELLGKNLLMDKFLARLEERAANLIFTPYKVTAIKPEVAPMTVIITDTHIGLKTETYNMKVIKKNLQVVVDEIVERRVDGQKVNVIILGDTIHSISGMQHPDIWQRIEEGAWGADIIIDTFQILADFLLSIPGLGAVYGVGGSHDRIIPNKAQEDESQGSKLLFYMLGLVLKQRDIKVEYGDHLNVFDEGNIRFICVHGDQGLDRKPAQEIAWMKGDQSKFNLILEGHYHTFYVPKGDTSKNFMKLHCPSFCAQDQFAEKHGLDSLDGFVIVVEKRGLPSITIEPLNY